jgi:hypothetical protein
MDAATVRAKEWLVEERDGRFARGGQERKKQESLGDLLWVTAATTMMGDQWGAVTSSQLRLASR